MKKHFPTLFALLCFSCLPQKTQQALDVAEQAVLTVPTRVCLEVNLARPRLLLNAGQVIRKTAMLQNWEISQEQNAILDLHAREDALRALVSPRWEDSGGPHFGECRLATERLEELLGPSKNLRDLSTPEEFEALYKVAQVLEDTMQAVSHMGVEDPYAWLETQDPVLARALREFLAIARAF